MNYFPLAAPFLILFLFVIGFALALIEIGVLQYAYEKVGVNRRYVFSLLLLSLLGSYVNIPLFRLPPEELYPHGYVLHYGMSYIVPQLADWRGTLVAVNLGGAVIPTLLSAYLILKNRILAKSVIGTVAVALVIHALAHPVRGVGIAIPTFIPPIVAAVTALILSRGSTPALAYIVGSLGTLIGADLMNLGRLGGLGAPVASIGGAGTFDGIFVTGILAVLLAGIVTPGRSEEARAHGV